MMTERDSASTYLFDAYRQWFPTYLRTVGLLLAVVAVASFLMPHTYTATSSLMPPETKSGAGGLSSLLQGAPIAVGLGAGENKTSMMFAEILESRTLLERVIDTLRLRQHPLFEGLPDYKLREVLQADIELDMKKTGSVVIDVDVSTGWLPFWGKKDMAATIAADIANQCCRQLDLMSREKSVSQARKTRLYIERVMASNRRIVDSLQNIMQEFQQSNKVVALEEQLAAMAENASMVGAALAQAEIELALTRQEFQPSSAQVALLQTKVDRLREQYGKVQTGGLVQTDGFSIPMDKIPALSRQYLNLTRDLKIKEQINAYLETQRLQEQIQEEKDTPAAVILDVAKPPEKRSSPKLSVMLMLSWLIYTAAFAVGIPAGAALRARRRNVAAS
ncbi:MAG: hypothetical protein FGM24_08880 [Candidatus Kapabacteria bacterium]|nr:hypothetical protein [Candidatus Kapabacteria bacterium]